MKREVYEKQAKKTLAAFAAAGIVLTDAEKEKIEVADFGLRSVEKIGLQLLTYVNTGRVCAKEMVLFPHQACPEHQHVSGEENGIPFEGKEETFRVRRGVCYLYVPGEGSAEKITGGLPPTDVTVFHEIVLKEGEQYTIYPDTPHWFRAGEEGAIVSEFSTRSRDERDEFTDPRVIRAPRIEE